MLQFSTAYIYKNINHYKIDVHTGSFDEIDLSQAIQSYGIILNQENELLLCYNSDSGFWILPGGTVEAGETTIDTLIREVYEESAVVVDAKTIEPAFYQEVFEVIKEDDSTDGKEEEKFEALQVRYIARPERIDKFISDPGGSMTEVKWVKLEELGDYLKWGETNNLIIQIIEEYLA